MSETILIEYDAVDALVAQLDGLAGELCLRAEDCRSAPPSLTAAVPGDAGAAAAAAGSAWAALLESLARQVGTFATALGTLCAEYRSVDATLAAALGDAGPGRVGGR